MYAIYVVSQPTSYASNFCRHQGEPTRCLCGLCSLTSDMASVKHLQYLRSPARLITTWLWSNTFLPTLHMTRQVNLLIIVTVSVNTAMALGTAEGDPEHRQLQHGEGFDGTRLAAKPQRYKARNRRSSGVWCQQLCIPVGLLVTSLQLTHSLT